HAHPTRFRSGSLLIGMIVSTFRTTALGWMIVAYFGHVNSPFQQQSTVRATTGPATGQLFAQALTVAQSQTDKTANGGSVSVTVTSPSAHISPATAAEIQDVEAMQRAILDNQPIQNWRFETVRAGYLSILKRVGQNPDVEEAIRLRLARVSQHEQAAE